MSDEQLTEELRELSTLALSAGRQGKYLLAQGEKELWYNVACEQKRLLERVIEILELLGQKEAAHEGRQLAMMDELILRAYREGKEI